MRLEKIKLAGFKSFVDPTQIPLPGNLVGIVGPNGCGKSNVIDAVRWVMGESSAKHLRGDLMADVIFNGSSARKPVGMASVELLFDNSDGSVSGEYAGYNQISIKRQVTRDGQSTYLLNGTRCRRKDITDLFLGTGLGPRSYAIIEQGTISRLIEAKPEELRTFLEEAAGISRYKERRRDTENRIRRTRENLDRIADLCDELEKQCRHLKRQATIAEKYKELKQQERQLKSELLALRWQAYEQQTQQHQKALQQAQNAVEECVAQLISVENELEQQRQAYTDSRDLWTRIQSDYYAVGAEIAKLEQSLQHRKQLRQQRQQLLQEHQRVIDQTSAALQRETGERSQLQDETSRLQTQLEQTQSQHLSLESALQQADQAMSRWQQVWDDFAQQAAEPRRTAEVERARINQIEKNLSQMGQRQSHLQQEIERLGRLAQDADIEPLAQRVSQSEAERDRLQSEVQRLSGQVVEQRQRLHQLSDQLAHARQEHSAAKGRLASIDALQQAALGKEQGARQAWLEQHNLQNYPRLAERLRVESGWERAVEVALAQRLDAICVDQLSDVFNALEGLPAASVTLLQSNGDAAFETALNALPLRSKLQDQTHLGTLLNDVYCVESLAEALDLQTTLTGGQSVVTRGGIWIGRDWLHIHEAVDPQESVLAREKAKRELTEQCDAGATVIQQLERQVDSERVGVQSAEQRREVLHKMQTEQDRTLSKLTIQLNEKKHRCEQARQRQTQLQSELSELQQRDANEQSELGQSRDRLAAALDQVDVIESKRETLQQDRSTLKRELEAARAAFQQAHDAVHGLQLRLETNRSSLALNQRNDEALRERIQQAERSLLDIQNQEQVEAEPQQQEQAQLEQLLSQRQEVEQKLTGAREKVESAESQIRTLESQRHTVEQTVQHRRDAVNRVQLDSQETTVRQQTILEQLQQSGADLRTLLQALPEAANESQWQSDVDALAERIHRLGPINLTAIEEYSTQSERKTYLDQQREDLNESLATLEQAIGKIDRESRQLFKDTFDKVNAGFEVRFPKLFGGGHAYLQLTGEDLLETGVTVMARPPGKRNSSIHLLSGGEKALTAVALVFAIFDLNPAPFCMLDEVDAPLDEANVGRFGNLVREMSEQVQIVLITHNKATMEIANQLAGVTMNEPGVSRLVAVDLDEAVEMVAV